ncbi:MAG TPA: (4Fe-4S)-binding protein [Deinococcales bacterium]|nr:(4Fe-4S)-binding protein [Deinococcales bacterium]
MPETPSVEPARKRYPGEGFEVTWAPSVCTHSGVCVRSLPPVFKPGERPWVHTAAAAAAEIEAAVARCPSGALRFRRLDAVEGAAQP